MATAPPLAAELWPDYIRAKMIVFDFDKTITSKHTRGAIFQPAQLDPAVLKKNFANLEFFQQLIPAIYEHCMVCIATFADREDEAICSGSDLVRKYLDVAFDDFSQRYIPDANIEAWNPENREMDAKKVGKNLHLDALRKRLCPGLKKRDIVLFDDSESNVIEAIAKGYGAHLIEPARGEEEEVVVPVEPSRHPPRPPGGLSRAAWNRFLESERKRSTEKSGCAMM